VLRELADPANIFAKSSELLGRFLEASRVVYGDYDPDHRLVTYHSCYCDGAAGLSGTFPTSSFGSDNLAGWWCSRARTSTSSAWSRGGAPPPPPRDR
jgi:hypothetical protein